MIFKMVRVLLIFLFFLSHTGTDVFAVDIFGKARVSVEGIGKIKIGMTIKQAKKASDTVLTPAQPIDKDEEGCFYVYPKGDYKSGISFMVTEGVISRIDISSKSIMTLEGAKIGDNEEKIKQIYKGIVKIEPHHYGYPPDHYLIVEIKPGFKIIFETDGKKVTNFRAGKTPEVEYVEGCL